MNEAQASPVIKIACLACGAQPGERCASDRYPSGVRECSPASSTPSGPP